MDSAGLRNRVFFSFVLHVLEQDTRFLNPAGTDYGVVVVMVSNPGISLMQFSIYSYPERVISYCVDDIYIINKPSFEGIKFRYFNISN